MNRDEYGDNPADKRTARFGRDLAFGVIKNTNACWRSVLHLSRQLKGKAITILRPDEFYELAKN